MIVCNTWKRDWILPALVAWLVSGALEAHPGTGVVIDSEGRAYVADPERNRVWMIPDALGKVGAPVVALAAHVHALAISPDGAVLAEEQHYDSASQAWINRLWQLDEPNRAELLETQRSEGFATSTSSRMDRQGNHYAWSVDMAHR